MHAFTSSLIYLGLEDWDLVGDDDISISRRVANGSSKRQLKGTRQASSSPLAANIRSITAGTFLQNFSQHVEKTVSSIEKAIGGKLNPI